MVTNKTILSYDLRPVLTTRGTTALTGVINGVRAFVPSFSTVAEFEAAVAKDNVVLASVTESATRKNLAGEDFVSPTTFNWVKKAVEQTAAEQWAMQTLLMGTLTREKTERVDHGALLVQIVQSKLEAIRENAALAELQKQAELALAGGAATEPAM